MKRKIITKNPIKWIMLKGGMVLLLALFTFNLSAQITVDATNQPLKEILKQIEKKSEYRFFYNEDLKGLDKICSLRVVNESVEKTMTLLLANSDIKFKLDKNNLVVLGTKAAQPEQKGISGVVTDKNGEPIIGASILIKGSTTGTVTDVKGNFNLNAHENAILDISYIRVYMH